MGRFERPRERNRDSRGSSRGGSRNNDYKENSRNNNYRDNSRNNDYRDNSRRSFGRDSNRRGRDRPEPEMTKVICSACGDECEVPFKPTLNKPVYCKDCYSKKDKTSFNNPSNRDLDVINEKLNKIMKALKIE